MNKELNINSQICFLGFLLLVILSGILSFSGLALPAILLPIGLLLVLWTIVDYKKVFYSFFLILPFSIEIYLPNGLGTDLPSEPFMVYLMFLFVFLLIWKGKNIDKKLFTHPITLILALHIIWIGVTSVLSTFPIISFKFFLAKMWYVLPFYFLPLLLINSHIEFEKLIKYLILGTTLSVIYVVVRHAGLGFSFSEINPACKPIYRNHVSYAGILVVTIPYVWALYKTQKAKWFYLGLLLLFLIATYLTYTRAAYGIVFLCIPMYWIIKWKLVKPAVISASVVVLLGIGYYIHQNRYLILAPNFEKTIMHEKFDNLLEATYKMEDISTMERLYRWVAGFRMVHDKPVFGFGAGTFYSNYQSYTLNSFRTYVSHNPEKSGVHSYYLMVAIEQGILGLLLFLALAIIPLFLAEKSYHLLNDASKYWLMGATLSFFSILVLIVINDMLEADKVGPFFFLSLAMVHILHKKAHKTRP